MTDLEKIYTQEDVDNITTKVKESQKAKYEKTHISLDAYKELEDKYNNLLMKEKNNDIKSSFLNNGGNEKAFDDFISLNKEIYETKDVNKFIEELKTSKPYFFNSKPQQTELNDTEIVKSMLGNNIDDLIPGTIYKK